MAMRGRLHIGFTKKHVPRFERHVKCIIVMAVQQFLAGIRMCFANAKA